VVRIGILALQGDFEAHAQAVLALGHEACSVKTASELETTDALVLPGGESGTMLKLLLDEGLFEPLRESCVSGRPVLGTCAGAILLARAVTGPVQQSLEVIDMEVIRNGYGRQRDSFITTVPPGTLGGDELETVFIRAPLIRATGPEVDVVLEHDGHPILVRQGPVWAATFHPEMSDDRRVLSAVLEGLPG
jgi:5'-phosphate synthase pdxT subunit